MNTIKFYFSLIIMVSILPPLNAQLSRGGTPYSLTHTVGDSIPTIVLPPVNVDSLLQVETADTTGGPLRIGSVHQVSLNITDYGIWETLPDNSQLWRLRLVSSDALGIRVIYDDFRLITGADLFLYNESRTDVIGSFTDANNRDDYKFLTTTVHSDSVILELHEPYNQTESSYFEIRKVSHIYRGFGDSVFDCQLNVGCSDVEAGYPISDYADQIRSVAKIISNDGEIDWTCSGALINNSENLRVLIINIFLQQSIVTLTI